MKEETGRSFIRKFAAELLHIEVPAGGVRDEKRIEATIRFLEADVGRTVDLDKIVKTPAQAQALIGRVIEHAKSSMTPEGSPDPAYEARRASFQSAAEAPARMTHVSKATLRVQAEALWTYAGKTEGMDEEAVWRRLVELSDDNGKTFLRTEKGGMNSLGLVMWADNAFPVVQLGGHRYAAALMSTAAPHDFPVRAPWSSFIIDLPVDMLHTTDEHGVKQPLVFLLVQHIDLPVKAVGEPKIASWSFTALTEKGVSIQRWRQPLAVFVKEVNGQDADLILPFDLEATSEDDRTMFLLARLVVNTCIAMSDPLEVRPIGDHPKDWSRGPGRVNKEPAYRTFKVGRAIEMDCRPALRDYIAGKRNGPLTVQFLVRGHWRQQACGPAMTERRLMWIRPYWKGPEEAPILVRPHVVGVDPAP